MNQDISERIIAGLEVIPHDSIKNDVSIIVAGLLGEIPTDDALKTSIAFALVEFYVEKIEGKAEFPFGTLEYDAYEKKLRTWETVIGKCLRALELKRLIGSENIAELQRNIATYFSYIPFSQEEKPDANQG